VGLVPALVTATLMALHSTRRGFYTVRGVGTFAGPMDQRVHDGFAQGGDRVVRHHLFGHRIDTVIADELQVRTGIGVT
jgi:hypothetical protein